MNSFRRKILLYIYKFSDVVLMVVAFSFATVATHFQKDNIPFEEFLNMRIALKNFIIFMAFALIWYIIFSMLNLYNSRRLSNRLDEIVDIFKATALGTFILFLASVILQIEMVTAIFLLVFLSTVSFLTTLFRISLRIFLGGLRKQGRNMREMLIAGTNERALKFAKSIESRPELGYHISGFVDQEWPGIDEFKKSGYTLVSDFNSFLPFVRHHVVDEVVINLPMKSCYEHAAEIAEICAEQGIIVRQFSNNFSFSNGSLNPKAIEGSPLLTVTDEDVKGFYLELKRAADFLVSAFLMVLTSPLFLIIALLIKSTSKGPVFFIQERVGLNKRIFKMYKFRTMVLDAEKKQAEIEHLNEAGGPVFKIKDDPRITPVGKFLRKSSFDELPQLLNILKGEMSFVGPRPLPIRDYNGFNKDWHRRRLSVRPGLTCLWQVNGRSDVTFDKWMKLDLEYIDNWSPWLDIKILLKTIPAVLKGSGAA